MVRLSQLFDFNLTWPIGLAFMLGIAFWAMINIWSLLGTLTGAIIFFIAYGIAKKWRFVTTKITMSDIFYFIVPIIFFQILIGTLYNH